MLLDDIASYICRYGKMPLSASDTLTAWSLHTHVARHLYIVAYIHLFSAEKQCGKTVVMDLMRFLCADPVNGGDASVAFIARSLDKPRTVFIDELDSVFRGDKERAEMLRGILNTGYKKSGRYGRCESPTFKPVEYSTFGPKIFAGIKRISLPDTVRDRSIAICLKRILLTDHVEQFFEEEAQALADPLRESAIAWITNNAGSVVMRIKQLFHRRRNGEEPILEQLQPRAFEIWAPLVAICDIAAGNWPEKIRVAAQQLMLGKDLEDQSLGVALLSDIRRVRDGARPGDPPARMWSTELVTRLCELEEPSRDWPGMIHGKPITMNWLASALREYREYGISSQQIKIGDENRRGYDFADFKEAWSALCSSFPVSSATAATSLTPPSFAATLQSATEGNGSSLKNCANLDGISDVAPVALVGNQERRDQLDLEAVAERWREYAEAHPEFEVPSNNDGVDIDSPRFAWDAVGSSAGARKHHSAAPAEGRRLRARARHTHPSDLTLWKITDAIS